jgi:N-acetylglucosamine kinase-like BadF-type ATPase
MLLFADGGSTKCDWVGLDTTKKVVFKTTTQGLNPAILDSSEIKNIINASEDLQAIKKQVDTVDFYGAGCGTEKGTKKITAVLSIVFPKAKITVKEDLYAAVHAVTTTPAIVCILGTGSNSCFYDTKTIKTPFPALGYILMDDGSGNYFGKQLLRDYFFKIMPKELRLKFKSQYDLSPQNIKDNLYQEPKPNAYLASFSKFIFNESDQNEYFRKLLAQGFSIFIKNHVLCFKQSKSVPIHFVGSIAYFGKDMLVECLKNFNLQPGTIIQKPIPGLITYYQKQTN